jgi:uncharacterized protein (TIGR03546 family)
MITRKIGKILRGTATPFQLYSACILMSVAGFMPGLEQATGSLIFILLALLILNANLVLGAFAGIAAKLLSLVMMPVTFSVGQFLLDGPTQGLFKGLINAPVVALFGLEYYVGAGGWVVGTVFGAGFGFATVHGINTFRRKMADLDEASEKFKEFNSKAWVKACKFIFIGGAMKKSYKEILDKQNWVGNPIRPVGVVAAILTLVVVFCVQAFFGEQIMTAGLRSGLEQANGATVDVESAEMDLKENKLLVNGLAVADPNALDTDLLRAATLEADISGANLLRKRIQLDRVVISDASTGEKRRLPGRLVGRRSEPSASDPGASGDGAKGIDDYMEDAKKWKERLRQVRDWLEKMSDPEQEQGDGPADETLQERLEREIAELGYRRVKASHLIDGSPTVVIAELIINGMRVPQLAGETLDIKANNLSTQPWLVAGAPAIVANSSSNSLALNLVMGESAATKSENIFDLKFNGLETDMVASGLKLGGEQTLSGGTMDLLMKGSWSTAGGVSVNLPLNVTLHNAKLNIPQLKNAMVETLTIPIGIEGPLDQPRIKTDTRQFADALAKAGLNAAKTEVTDRAMKELNKQLDGKLPGGLGGEAGDAAKGLIDGLFGGKKK